MLEVEVPVALAQSVLTMALSTCAIQPVQWRRKPAVSSIKLCMLSQDGLTLHSYACSLSVLQRYSSQCLMYACGFIVPKELNMKEHFFFGSEIE